MRLSLAIWFCVEAGWCSLGPGRALLELFGEKKSGFSRRGIADGESLLRSLTFDDKTSPLLMWFYLLSTAWACLSGGRSGLTLALPGFTTMWVVLSLLDLLCLVFYFAPATSR